MIKYRPMIQKGTMTHVVNLVNESKKSDVSTEEKESMPAPYVFYRPKKVLKFKEIIDELYENPNRGLIRVLKLPEWAAIQFDDISKEELLNSASQTARESFDNHGYTMDFFGDIDQATKTKMLEHFQDPTTRWIGPYQHGEGEKSRYIYSYN